MTKVAEGSAKRFDDETENDGEIEEKDARIVGGEFKNESGFSAEEIDEGDMKIKEKRSEGGDGHGEEREEAGRAGEKNEEHSVGESGEDDEIGDKGKK